MTLNPLKMNMLLILMSLGPMCIQGYLDATVKEVSFLNDYTHRTFFIIKKVNFLCCH